GVTLKAQQFVVKGKPFIKVFGDVAALHKQLAVLRAMSPGEKWRRDREQTVANLKGDWEWSPTGEVILAVYDFDTGQWRFPLAAELERFAEQVEFMADPARALADATTGTNPFKQRYTSAQQWEN